MFKYCIEHVVYVNLLNINRWLRNKGFGDSYHDYTVITSDLKVKKQCSEVVNKANQILDTNRLNLIIEVKAQF